VPETERDNYYVLLELQLNPPVMDPGQIKAALRLKKQEWTRWQDHPLKRNDGITYLDMAGDIERVMLDPVLREKEAFDAKEIGRKMHARFEAELRVLESKGYILPKEMSAIAVKYKKFGVTEKLVAESAKSPVSETLPAPKDDGADGVLDRVTARNIIRGLRILGFSTLYAFLEEPPYSSVKKLQAAAERVRRASAAQGGRSHQAVISAELAGICTSLFESVASKQTYDRYVKISKYPAVSEVDEEVARSGHIGPDVMIRIVNFAVEAYDIKILEAEEYIKNYCAAYDIPLSRNGAQVFCPNCACKMPKNSKVCRECSQPFSGDCPECGEPFEGGCAVCSGCGFKTGNMGKALEFLDKAENALVEKDWSTAKKALAHVNKCWPYHQKLEVLEMRAALLERRYMECVQSATDLVNRRKLYAAKELIDEAALHDIRLPAGLVKNVAVEIAAFEKRVENLIHSGEPDVELLLRLSADVTDSIELGRLLSSHPPRPPTEFMAKVQDGHIALSWGESPSAYTDTYFLLRKKNSMPLSIFDGELLYEGSSHAFTDMTAIPLTSYCYCLFSKRAGTHSRAPIHAKPVMIVPEIKNLKILPMDMAARLTWDFNPGLSEVKIRRGPPGGPPLKPGEGELLTGDRLDGYSDTQLLNDVEYWYHIVAGYVVNGVPVYAKGVLGSVIPRKFIAPVEELNILETEEPGSYIVSWNAETHSDILMLASASRPDFSEGDVFLAEDLLKKHRKLELCYKNAGSAIFACSFSGGMYMFAAFVFGRFATVSEPRYIVSVPDVQSPVCDVIDGSLYISVTWPPLVSDIIIAYRSDRFPERPDEPGAAALSCSRSQYDQNAAAVIGDPAPALYHIVIFSEFTAPTGQKVYSKGARLFVDNRPKQEVFYSFSYKKKMFSDTGVLEVTLSSADEFVMPKSVITGRVGRLPLNRADGLKMFETEEDITISDSLTIPFDAPLLPSGIYLRLFFDDDLMYGNLRLIPASAVKIN